MVISTCVASVATLGILIFTRLTYKLYRSMQQKQEEQEHRFNDLLEAIVIATLLTGPGHNTSNYFENGKRYFMQAYKGKTNIFKEE